MWVCSVLASAHVCVLFFLFGCKGFKGKEQHEAVSNGRSLREEGHVTYEDVKSIGAAAIDVLDNNVDDRRSAVEVAASL